MKQEEAWDVDKQRGRASHKTTEGCPLLRRQDISWVAEKGLVGQSYGSKWGNRISKSGHLFKIDTSLHQISKMRPHTCLIGENGSD